MPLAIEVTAALLSTKNLVLHDIISEYIEQVSVYMPRPLQWSYDKHRSIEEILELIIDAIKDDETHAAKLLIMSSLIGPTEIPLAAFENLRFQDTLDFSSSEAPTKVNMPITNFALACSAWLLKASQGADQVIMAAFNQLEDLGLAKSKRNSSGRIVSFSIHNLIRTLSVRRIGQDEKRELIFLLAQSLCESFEDGTSLWKKSNRCVQLARFMLEHLREFMNDTEVLMVDSKYFDHYRVMCAKYGAFFMNNRHCANAKDAYELAYQCDFLGRQPGQPFTKASLASMQGFALACRSNGDPDKALEVFQHIYYEGRNTYGVDDNLTIKAAD